MRVLQDEQPGDQPHRQRRLTRPRLAHCGKALLQELPVDLTRQAHQRLAHVDDLIQRRPEQILLSLVARLRHSFSPKRYPPSENHEAPKIGIPKRKKAGPKPRFPAKSITHPLRLMPTTQRDLNSSRATTYRNCNRARSKLKYFSTWYRRDRAMA